MSNKPLSAETYDALISAYERFVSTFFAHDNMPDPIITLARKKGANGYHWHGVWANDVSEIALMPESLAREPQDVLGTLLHEAVHHWQQHNGKPSKGGYHNGEWAERMLSVGLTPVSFDQEGKMTGRKVSHVIDADGPADLLFRDMLAEGWRLPVEGLAVMAKPARKDKSKTPYCCHNCDMKIWGKPDMTIICGECGEEFEEQA